MPLSRQQSDYFLTHLCLPPPRSVRLDKKHSFYVLLNEIVFQGLEDLLGVVSAGVEAFHVRTVVERENDFDGVIRGVGFGGNRRGLGN